MQPILSAVVLGLLAFPILASGQAGGQTQPPAQGEVLRRTFDHDGKSRTYRLYVPAAYHTQEGGSTDDWPLVVSYHGFHWVPTRHASLDGLNAVADTAHFLVARPLGLSINVSPAGTSTGWNADGGFGDWDDFSFTSQLIDHVVADYRVDLRRIHATGFSFGGMMSFGVACRLADRVASIAGVDGPLQEVFFEDCGATRPVSTLLFFGTADEVHRYTGYVGDDFAPRPIPETPSFWARHNNCSPDPVVTDLPDVDPQDSSTVTLFEYTDCDMDTEVQFYRVNNGGHSWPRSTDRQAGLGTVNMDVDATSLIWDFFVRNPRPGPPPMRFDWTPHTDLKFDGRLPSDPWADLYGVSFSDARTGTVVGGEGTIFRTTDGGETWQSQSSGTTESLWAVDFADTSTGTAVGNEGTILRTTDGGATWGSQSSGTTVSLRAVALSDTRTGTVVGREGTILRTTDGGGTWQSQSSGTTDQLLDVELIDVNTATVVGGNGTILRTTNGGETWVSQSSGVTSMLLGVDFTDAGTGIAVGGFGAYGLTTNAVILRTTDGGETWITLLADIATSDLKDVHFVDGNHAMIVGGTGFGGQNNGEIFYTSDGGATWERQLTGYRKGFHCVSAADAGAWTAVGSDGAILRVATAGSGTAVEEERRTDRGIPRGFSLSQNHPNPFNSETVIPFTLPVAADVELALYNLGGQRVATLAQGWQPAGAHTVRWDGRDDGLREQASGVYLLRLQVGQQAATRKLVLVR